MISAQEACKDCQVIKNLKYILCFVKLSFKFKDNLDLKEYPGLSVHEVFLAQEEKKVSQELSDSQVMMNNERYVSVIY